MSSSIESAVTLLFFLFNILFVPSVGKLVKEEDNLLNKNKLRSKLPQGMTIDMLLENNPTIMFDIRYKFVGIK